MHFITSIADFGDAMKIWRRWMHAHPALGLKCHATAAYVVKQLRAFWVDKIHERIGVSGAVEIINGQGVGDKIGLLVDMDALPIEEMNGADHVSLNPGLMHACGHEGHTTMLSRGRAVFG